MSSNEKTTSRILLLLLLCVTFINIGALVNMSEAMETPKQTETSRVLMSPLLDFTSKLFPLASEGKENVILSPISIHKALSLVLLGTDNSTETERQLLAALGYGQLNPHQVIECHEQYSKLIQQFKSITKETLELRQKSHEEEEYHRGGGPPILDVFNMVITHSNLGQVRTDYGDKIKKYYDSTIEVVDPTKQESIDKLLNTLNDWAKKADFKEPIMSESELKKQFAALLLSAIRVEAFWFSEFYESKDKAAFHQMGLASQPVNGSVLSNGDIYGAKYIELVPPTGKSRYPNLQSRVRESPEGKLYDELAHLSCQLVEVDLEGGLSFAIVEPLNVSGSGGELAKLRGQLMSGDTLTKVITLLDSEASSNRLDRLSFPKFQFENELNLNSALKTMGLSKAFDNSQAEIKQMMQQGGVYIDSVKHQAMIEATKQGIKAAGVTKVAMSMLSAFRPEEPLNVDIRNPFMFMLRFEQIPLFVGQLMRI